MNYDKMLKDINDATALRGVIESVAQNLRGIDSQIEGNKREIDKRKSLEEATENLKQKRIEVANTLAQHEAEMQKRLDSLEKAGVTLPFEAKPTPFVHS